MLGVDDKTYSAFLTYHRNNPHIWQSFEKFALEMLNTGRKRYSAKTIMERVRWDFDSSNPEAEYKINNDFTSYYARAFARKWPQFREFFEFREVKGLKRAA